MKKLLALIMALALVFSFCGCDNSDTNNDNNGGRSDNNVGPTSVLYQGDFPCIEVYEWVYSNDYDGIKYVSSTGEAVRVEEYTDLLGYEVNIDNVIATDVVMITEDLVLFSDGTVGESNEGTKIDGLTDVVAIDSDVCLKSDGTVVPGENKDFYDANEWTDIIAISTNDRHLIGLKSDGTLVATGNNTKGECDVEKWENIVAICTATNTTYALKADGTVLRSNKYSTLDEVDDWTNIVAISVSGSTVFGLKADGTVVSCGKDKQGETKISDWKDIVAIKVYDGLSIGIKADGTVVSAGEDYIISKYLKDVKIKVN